MERVCKMILIIGSVVAAMSAVSGAAPMEFTHQGRLADATGVAVSGNVAMAFRLFDSSTDGSLIWSETHPSVSVVDGLFSVSLGSSTALDADMFAPPSSGGLPPVERYLEIEVGGEVISPRTRLVSSPYALVAERVSGDIYTGPGDLLLQNGDGKTIELHLQPLGGAITINGQFEELASLSGSDTGSVMKLSCCGSLPSPGHTTLRVMAANDSLTDYRDLDSDGDGIRDMSIETKLKNFGLLEPTAIHRMMMDSDGDGLPEQEISSSIVPTKSNMAINTKGTGAQNGRVVAIQSETTVDSAVQSIFVDEDGDANKEAQVTIRAEPQSGISPLQVRMACELDSNDDGNLESNAFTLVMADSIIDYRDVDDDGDGVSDAEALTRLLAHEVTHIVQQRSGTGPNQLTMVSETKSDTGGVSQELGIKKGINAVNVSTSHRTLVTTQALYRKMIGDFDDDGDPEQEISSSIVPTKSQMAINTKGTGAQNGRVVAIMSETTVDSAMHISSIDHNGDGLVDIAIASACTVDSVYESTTFNYPDASSPTSESGRVFRSRKSKTYQEMHNTEIASKTVVEFTCDSATSSSVWSADDFSGLPATSLTIQASTDPFLNPIEHSSGAHLTPGGSWTNSSDAGLKENFESIDGDELLSKIDQLEIHEWNYITESDNIKHIGPTAQDFESVFNLGTDGKSISTIDPAGIALAAIKALNEKSKRVDELEKDVEELKRIVEQLMNKVK